MRECWGISRLVISACAAFDPVVRLVCKRMHAHSDVGMACHLHSPKWDVLHLLFLVGMLTYGCVANPEPMSPCS